MLFLTASLKTFLEASRIFHLSFPHICALGSKTSDEQSLTQKRRQTSKSLMLGSLLGVLVGAARKHRASRRFRDFPALADYVS